MKHKHSELIKAKADNKELVIFKYSGVYGRWIESNFVALVDDPCHQYFLCLPQHKEACLHWLNGGEVELYRNKSGNFAFVQPITGSSWGLRYWYMNENKVSRIKAK